MIVIMECEVKVGCEGNENGDENGFKGADCDVGEEAADLRILEDLDSYLADIDDRLMISRMVNESVTKGMVNAVEEEAAELIAAKEMEMELLKKSMLLNKVSSNEVEINVENGKELDTMRIDGLLSCTDGLREHDKMRESVDRLRVEASKQCAKIKEELDTARGCNSIKRIGSGEMLGLGGILPEKAGDNWVPVYKLLDGLQNTVTLMCTQVSNDLQMSTVLLKEREQQREVQRDIESIVMQSFLTSHQEESGGQNVLPCDNQNVNWQKKLDELSVLHKELDSLLKSLKNPENGHLISNGSIDLDSSHSKFHGKHVLPPTSFWHGNEKMDDSKMSVPETLDAAQFKHLKREELVSYFNSTISKMKRDHESIVGKMTDDYFNLKREYLNVKERSPSLPHWKDNNEVDMVRKKIPDVISKLDKILSESADIALLSNGESISKLKDRSDSLISENCQLNRLLKDRENEINCLWSQISDAKEKMLKHSMVEADMMKVIENLKATIKDEHVEAETTETINKCFLESVIDQIRCDFEESSIEVQNVKEMYHIMLSEGVTKGKYDFEDPSMESLITQDICGVLFREAINDAQQKFRDLYSKYLQENEKSISHEKKALEKETRLWQIIKDKERLGQQVLELESSAQEKDKMVRELSRALANERDHFERVSKELNNLKDETSHQQMIASERAKKLESARDQLTDAFQLIEHKKIEILKLHQMLENKTEELKQIDGQREALRERYTHLVQAEGKSKELEKQMKVVLLDVQVLSNTLVDFEKRVLDGLKANSLRLDSLSSHLKSVIREADMLKRSVLVYKDQVEKRTSDIQMAEAEVDLLGDEVDVLLGLLEKIYIGLDHYSPVLKHYPGIMEILQLVRRELSGVRPKSV